MVALRRNDATMAIGCSASGGAPISINPHELPLHVLSGGTSDIGRAIALRLARSGRSVVALGRDAAGLASLQREAPERIQIKSLDLLDDTAVTQFAASLTASTAGVAGLVHCAGAYSGGPIKSAALAELDLMYRSNVRAPYLLTQLLIPALARAKGHVVFINSTAGLRPKPNLAGYSGSQHSLRVLADALRDEVNALGVRVTSLYLGRTATQRIARVFKSEGRDFDPALLLQPADVAQTVLYALDLPPTAEAMDITIRPAIKSY
jgi:NADP-dependent 3-hydroxy acid dehydrogenase YdfG